MCRDRYWDLQVQLFLSIFLSNLHVFNSITCKVFSISFMIFLNSLRTTQIQVRFVIRYANDIKYDPTNKRIFFIWKNYRLYRVCLTLKDWVRVIGFVNPFRTIHFFTWTQSVWTWTQVTQSFCYIYLWQAMLESSIINWEITNLVNTK